MFSSLNKCQTRVYLDYFKEQGDLVIVHTHCHYTLVKLFACIFVSPKLLKRNFTHNSRSLSKAYNFNLDFDRIMAHCELGKFYIIQALVDYQALRIVKQSINF
jgi:hypothetical protein